MLGAVRLTEYSLGDAEVKYSSEIIHWKLLAYCCVVGGSNGVDAPT